MTAPTRTLLDALIRLGKGMLDACDKWVKAQPLEGDASAPRKIQEGALRDALQ